MFPRGKEEYNISFLSPDAIKVNRKTKLETNLTNNLPQKSLSKPRPPLAPLRNRKYNQGLFKRHVSRGALPKYGHHLAHQENSKSITHTLIPTPVSVLEYPSVGEQIGISEESFPNKESYFNHDRCNIFQKQFDDKNNNFYKRVAETQIFKCINDKPKFTNESIISGQNKI